jgi:hypothetical protein
MKLTELWKYTLRALDINKTLGTRRAAGYLRNRDVPLEMALKILVGPNCQVRA